MNMANLQARHARASMQEMPPDGAKLRVIIVEDSPLIRARLSESLSEIPNVEIVDQFETESAALAALEREGKTPSLLEPP
jgi:hypothetical protein